MTDPDKALTAEAARRRPIISETLRSAIGAAAVLAAVGSSLATLSYLDPQFDVVANFAPILLALSILALVLAIVIRRAFVVASVAALGAIASGWLVLPDLVASFAWRSAPARQGPFIKIVSANLLSTNNDYSSFEEMVRRERPDILILQEAFEYWPTRLDRLAGEYPTRAGCMYPNECNTVILSKFPSVGLLQPQASTFVAVRLRLPPRLGEGTLEAVSVHLSRPPPMDMHLQELERLKELSASLSSRAIVAGDFNATPWTSTIRTLDRTLLLERRTRALFSWPAPFPIAPVDHLYAGSYWRLASVTRGNSIGSDHYPIVTTMTLADSGPQ